MDELKHLLGQRGFALQSLSAKNNEKPAAQISCWELKDYLLFQIGKNNTHICIEKWNPPVLMLEKLLNVIYSSSKCTLCAIALKIPGVCPYCVAAVCAKCAERLLTKNRTLEELTCSSCSVVNKIRV